MAADDVRDDLEGQPVLNEAGRGRCRHCKEEVELINYALGPEWRHVRYPYRTRDSWWQCKAVTVAKPVTITPARAEAADGGTT